MTRTMKTAIATMIMAGSLMMPAMWSAPAFTVLAEKKDPDRQSQVKKSKTGDSPEVKDKQCSEVSAGGESVHFGKCGSVCKGKQVKSDSTREYGGDYFCEQ